MEPSRRRIVLASLFLTLIAVASCLIIFFFPDKTVPYWIGLAVGGSLGLLTIVYMIYAKVINIEEAQHSYKERMESPWLFVAVIGGPLLARVLFHFIDRHYQAAVISCVFSWIILTFSYVAFKGWIYFSRQ